MSGGHTPGPWVERECGIYSETAVPDWALCDPEEYADARVCIVNLQGAMGGCDAEADSRLMAASPELLAAVIDLIAPLERAAAELGMNGFVLDEYAQASFDRARAAIAKATAA